MTENAARYYVNIRVARVLQPLLLSKWGNVGVQRDTDKLSMLIIFRDSLRFHCALFSPQLLLPREKTSKAYYPSVLIFVSCHKINTYPLPTSYLLFKCTP